MPISTNYLDQKDEIIWFVTHRQLLVIAAIVEIGVSILLAKDTSSNDGLWLIGWLGAVFLVYRYARWAMHVTAPCHCLGIFVSHGADVAAKIALAWMLGGSFLLLTSESLLTTPRASSLKKTDY